MRFIFLALFLPLIGRVARYTPSSSVKNSSKNIKLKSYQFIFLPSLCDCSTPQYSIYGARRSMSCDVKSLSSASCDKLVMGP